MTDETESRILAGALVLVVALMWVGAWRLNAQTPESCCHAYEQCRAALSSRLNCQDLAPGVLMEHR